MFNVVEMRSHDCSIPPRLRSEETARWYTQVQQANKRYYRRMSHDDSFLETMAAVRHARDEKLVQKIIEVSGKSRRLTDDEILAVAGFADADEQALRRLVKSGGMDLLDAVLELPASASRKSIYRARIRRLREPGRVMTPAELARAIGQRPSRLMVRICANMAKAGVLQVVSEENMLYRLNREAFQQRQ